MRLPISIRFVVMILSILFLFFISACSSSTKTLSEEAPSSTSNTHSDDLLTTAPLKSTGIKVVIDPGHGGKEIGAKGKGTGVLEKDINLHVALLVKKDLESNGFSVVLTRETDQQHLPGDNKADLLARAHMAKSVGASMFVSIHADQYLPDRNVHGTKVYYFSENSKEIAQQFHDELISTLQSKPLGIHVNDFVVLRENVVPAVLIELGFLTHAEEELKLIDPTYQLMAAQSISKVIKQSFTSK
jgi:N-acetylmuramoyl-L-alanine amidase